MDIRLFLIFVVMLSAIQQGPAVYRDLTCVEPEPSFPQSLFHCFSATVIRRVCPTRVDLIWRIGNEVFCILLSVLLTLMLGFATSIGNNAREKWSAMVSMFQEWRVRSSRCRHCRTTPCQVKRKRLWMPSRSGKRSNANFAERSKGMMLFNYGLEVSVQLTKELPQDDIYWQWRFCERFEEKHGSVPTVYPASNRLLVPRPSLDLSPLFSRKIAGDRGLWKRVFDGYMFSF